MRILLICCMLLLTACVGPDPRMDLAPSSIIGHPDSNVWRAVAPLDTALLLSQLGRIDSASPRTPIYGLGGTEWQERIDAITVRYAAFACTCPDHIVLDSVRFEVKELYLRPYNEEVGIPERLHVAGNAFLLIGQRSIDTLAPPRTMGPPSPGYSFRYTSYRVKRPYQVWGPEVFDTKADILAGEDPWRPSVLTVR